MLVLLRKLYVFTIFRVMNVYLLEANLNSQVENLLDLKQKQANVDESRMARWQAEVTQNQSRSVMVFTVFTVMSASPPTIQPSTRIHQLNELQLPAPLILHIAIRHKCPRMERRSHQPQHEGDACNRRYVSHPAST